MTSLPLYISLRYTFCKNGVYLACYNMTCCLVAKSCPTLLHPHGLAHHLLCPLSMRFPRQEYWSGLTFPSPWDLPDPGIKPVSPTLAGRFFTAGSLRLEHGLISGYIVVSQIFWISEVFLTVGSKTEHFSMTPGFEAWLPK